MAKTKSAGTQSNFDASSLSQRDLDYLNMDTKDVMKKYKVGKQSVYDKRYALKKKLAAAGVAGTAPATKTANAKPSVKRGRPKKAESQKPAAEKVHLPVEEVVPESRQVMIVDKPLPVIMKPIEINFDNFSVKLNGVPKKISVNPDTNAIEIDL